MEAYRASILDFIDDPDEVLEADSYRYFEDGLLLSVGRALSEGLLRRAAQGTAGDRPIDDLSVSRTPPGVRTRTSIEAFGQDLETQVDALNCFEDALFAFETWGDDTDFTLQLTGKQMLAYADGSPPDIDEFLSLAIFYLLFGFDF